jgi:hypothetical protein
MVLLPIVLAGLVAAGVVAWRYAGAVVGLVVLAIAAYLDVQIVRFLRKHLKSWVETAPEGVTAHLPDGTTLHLGWKGLTRTGLCLRSGSRPFLFLYDGTQDRLLCVPNEYSHFDQLEQEIRGRKPKSIPFEEIRLTKEELIEDWLKEQIG